MVHRTTRRSRSVRSARCKHRTTWTHGVWQPNTQFHSFSCWQQKLRGTDITALPFLLCCLNFYINVYCKVYLEGVNSLRGIEAFPQIDYFLDLYRLTCRGRV